MFTIEQIKEAHSKVKSGSDFPAYIQDILKLGVKKYETFVSDGHTIYFGENNNTIQSPARYEPLVIAATCDPESFKADLKAHQQGKTDYATFCKSCAAFGVNNWIVDTDKMTCTYYDTTENEILAEIIPH